MRPRLSSQLKRTSMSANSAKRRRLKKWGMVSVTRRAAGSQSATQPSRRIACETPWRMISFGLLVDRRSRR